jgi:hypothetical protein
MPIPPNPISIRTHFQPAKHPNLNPHDCAVQLFTACRITLHFPLSRRAEISTDRQHPATSRVRFSNARAMQSNVKLCPQRGVGISAVATFTEESLKHPARRPRENVKMLCKATPPAPITPRGETRSLTRTTSRSPCKPPLCFFRKILRDPLATRGGILAVVGVSELKTNQL